MRGSMVPPITNDTSHETNKQTTNDAKIMIMYKTTPCSKKSGTPSSN